MVISGATPLAARVTVGPDAVGPFRLVVWVSGGLVNHKLVGRFKHYT